MKKICAFLLLSACTTTPQGGQMPQFKETTRVTVIGTETAQIKSPAVADPTEEDWKQSKESCVTHLYQCQYDDQGQVTQLKALDHSEPTFQSLTEEALRAWRFEAGKSGSCFTQMIYERGVPTRVLVVPQDMAQTMISNLEKNRAALPRPDPSKKPPTGMYQPKPEVPRELALKGRSGYIVVNFDLDTEGAPTNLKIVDEEPEGALETNVLRILKKWRYAKLADEPNSSRNHSVTIEVYLAGNPTRLSTCDVGLKLNRLARAHEPTQENTTGPRQAPNPSLK